MWDGDELASGEEFFAATIPVASAVAKDFDKGTWTVVAE